MSASGEPRSIIRLMVASKWTAVAELIHVSTNAYYTSHGMSAIFREGPEKTTRLFCEVYETLDPGCCLVAEHPDTGRLVGSCFYHPRETHYSIGIVNVHPSHFRIAPMPTRSQHGLCRAHSTSIHSLYVPAPDL